MPQTSPHTSGDDRSVALLAAAAGASVVAAGFGTDITEEMKGSVDPVSIVDRDAENAIITVLSQHRPANGVLAEERGGVTTSEGRRWIIDPLDGTVNFLHGIPHFGVSVALWVDDTPLACAVVDVLRDETYSAAAGAGADCNGLPISVSSRAELSNCIIATGFPYDRNHFGEQYAATAGKVIQKVRGIRRLGAAVLDLAWVACGRFDGFWEFNLAPWDIAAGLLLVAEAGGVSADLVDSPASLTAPAIILSNAALGDSLIELIRDEAPGHVRSSN